MTSYSSYVAAVLIGLLVASCGTTTATSDFCDLYDYQPYSEATKDFWRTTTDPGARSDRLRTAQTQKVYRCLCPEDHNEGTEGCPE